VYCQTSAPDDVAELVWLPLELRANDSLLVQRMARSQNGPVSNHIATAPRQVWCWGMTYLPANVQGR
jgi:hypothetical protein